jgi:signal peptidase I
MKLEAFPFYALGLAVVFGVAWWFETHEGHDFEQPEAKQYCRPQLKEGSFRWGRDGTFLDPADMEPGTLVLYRTSRSRGDVTSRVVATQGQRIKIEGGKVTVDGKKYDDIYARRPRKDDYFPELIVPTGCVFVLNDQRSRGGAERRDSRVYGPIPVGSIRLVFAAKERQEGSRR